MHNHHVSIPKIKGVPDLIHKEAVAAFVALAMISVIAAVSDAPIQGPAELYGIPGTHIKAPWIFAGIQQMLRWFAAPLAGIVIPGATLVLCAFLPIIPVRRQLFTATFFFILGLTISLTLWGCFS